MPNEMKFTASNVFEPSFLDRFRRQDDANTASEAEHAGPWTVREVEGGFGVFRESDADDAPPEATFEHFEHALLMAAVMPGIGREALFRVDPAETPEGYAVEAIWGESWNRTVGRLQSFEPEVADALHLAEALTRSPSALAFLLEAAGATALELAGRILARRLEEDAE